MLAEACNDLATFYYKHNRYDDALEEYKHEAGICKDLGLRLEWATCNRMIGEMYMLMAEFDKALKYEERHLGNYPCDIHDPSMEYTLFYSKEIALNLHVTVYNHIVCI